MKIRIRGKFWQFKREILSDARGTCDPPNAPGKSIVVDANLVGEEELEVVLHETLHSALWDLDEEAVTETAHDIARVLWKLGYRRVG